jgi:hypothetical protein
MGMPRPLSHRPVTITLHVGPFPSSFSGTFVMPFGPPQPARLVREDPAQTKIHDLIDHRLAAKTLVCCRRQSGDDLFHT